MLTELKIDRPIHVTKPKLPDFELYKEYIEGIWENQWLTNDGPLHEQFKENLKDYLNVSNLELFTNGHLALETAIKALDLKGEVITTPFTFASTTHAIVNSGLTPVFCDIEMDSFTIDTDQLEKHITSQTCAILAVHVFGLPCNLEKIEELAKKHNLAVIYDAAHTFGVEINGRSIADFGDVSMFSFHSTKVFHSIEGGLLSFQDEGLKQKLKALKNFGITSQDSVDYVGTNAKMNEFQAAMGLSNLQTIDEDISKRKLVHETYIEHLNSVEAIRHLPNSMENVKHNYSYFPILLHDQETRDQLHESLKNYNVFTRKYFYPLCTDFSCYAEYQEDMPKATFVSERILCLPMYTELETEIVQQICSIIRFELGE
ncbi:DegT/DnrJ/EryC1/StrS family aminotransferase [Fictibacillus sp. KIGAM418]|uniref:DegT/DnrJ/EryC1/StrS family aminotransferase n=1 Tax=Fictibacillus marinisediminis TaxID=2878389 RepID=A0A9X1XJM8_9BACL|nr:DegT/DnrJ/EryC1/StrS family aminotransferase [Fictibacillus marinisediminis]MCK6258764.1 DegT/DnrJ/EryC1/StrS family aminotransferase [Fictibacillus marinisediminis]